MRYANQAHKIRVTDGHEFEAKREQSRNPPNKIGIVLPQGAWFPGLFLPAMIKEGACRSRSPAPGTPRAPKPRQVAAAGSCFPVQTWIVSSAPHVRSKAPLRIGPHRLRHDRSDPCRRAAQAREEAERSSRWESPTGRVGERSRRRPALFEYTTVDPAEVIGDPTIQAILITSPTATHRVPPYAAPSRAMKPLILRKKAAGPSFEEVDALCGSVATSGLAAQVGFHFGFHPLVNSVA